MLYASRFILHKTYMENKLLGAGDLIEGSWVVCRKNWRKLAVISFWMFVPTLLQTIVSLAMRLLGVQEFAAAVIIIAVSLPSYVAQFIAAIVFVLAIDTILRGEEFDVRKLAEASLKKLWPVLLVVALTGLAIMAGLILFIIPGLIFSVWFAFAYYEAILADVRGTEALKRSRDLSSGRFWGVLWRLVASTIFWSVVVWLFMSAIFMLFGAITAPWKMTVGGEPGASFAAAFLEIVANAVQAASAPLFTAIGVLLYRAMQVTYAARNQAQNSQQ